MRIASIFILLFDGHIEDGLSQGADLLLVVYGVFVGSNMEFYRGKERISEILVL